MSNIKKQLRQLDVGKLKMKTGRTVEQELKHHAGVLADAIMEEMESAIYSYPVKVYKRTFELYNSLCIDDKVRVDVSSKGTGLSIGVHFSDEVMHENFFGDRVDVANILNEGYITHGSFADVSMLGFRDATKYIDNAILKYRGKVSNPFTVKFTINGEERLF